MLVLHRSSTCVENKRIFDFAFFIKWRNPIPPDFTLNCSVYTMRISTSYFLELQKPPIIPEVLPSFVILVCTTFVIPACQHLRHPRMHHLRHPRMHPLPSSPHAPTTVMPACQHLRHPRMLLGGDLLKRLFERSRLFRRYRIDTSYLPV